MKREEIKKILGQDADSEKINQILDAFHAELEAKTAEAAAKQRELEISLENAQADLKSANSTIRKLQRENPDVEELQRQIKEYERKNQELEERREADQRERDEEFVNSAIENDLVKHQVRDVKSAMVHYDRAKIKIGKDRSISGIEEQTAAIVKDKPYLFGRLEPVKKPQQDYSPKEGGDAELSFGARLAREHIKQMEERKSAVDQVYEKYINQ